MDVIYFYLGFYVVLYVYGMVFSLVGVKGLIWLEDGDSAREKRAFAAQFATLPLSVTLFASLLLDELLVRGQAADVAVQSPHYLKTFAFCAFQFLNSVCFDAFASFGLEPNFGLALTPSLKLGSLLIFSLSIFGGVAGLNIVLLALRSYRRHSSV